MMTQYWPTLKPWAIFLGGIAVGALAYSAARDW